MSNDNLDRAIVLVNDALARARQGDQLDISGLRDRWDGSTYELLAAALVVAANQPDPAADDDPAPAPRDFRRATAFLAGWATSDPAVFATPVQEAENDGRLHHLLVAVGEHAVLGLGLRTDPEQLTEMRRAIAVWTREENDND